MQEIGKHTPSTIRYNVEDRSRRHRGLSSSSFNRKSLSNTVQTTDHFLNNPTNILESRSFKNKDENDIVDSTFQAPVRFQRNLPFSNTPDLNPPFGENGENLMEF